MRRLGKCTGGIALNQLTEPIYPEIQKLDTWLSEKNWKRYPVGAAGTHVFFWQLKTDCKTLCLTNDVIRINLKAFDMSMGQKVSRHHGRWAFSIELTAQPPDGIWVEYRCPTVWLDDLEDCLDSQVKKLIRAWEATCI